MAKIEITGNAGFGSINYKANAGIEARLADLIERVWENGNIETRENPNHFYIGTSCFGVSQIFPDHPEIAITKRDNRGFQMVNVKGEFVQAVVAKLREVA